MGEIDDWIERRAENFLKEIGIRYGDVVLDFGSGVGHYSIPLAKVVGSEGRVYALDKDDWALKELRRIAFRKGLKNIQTIYSETKIPLEDSSVDAVLCYDVVHYERDRGKIYKEVYRVLKKDGLFSLYPKHHKEDYPLMELALLSLEDVIKEVEKAGFVLEEKTSKRCLHDDYMNDCQILNFKK